MKFRVFGVEWAAGGVKPLDVLKKYVKDTPVLVPQEDKRMAPHYDVEITPEEMMAMAASQEFDIMICARGFLAFDGKGRMFRQR